MAYTDIRKAYKDEGQLTAHDLKIPKVDLHTRTDGATADQLAMHSKD